MARQHTYGQHFLRSPRIAAELIGHSNIRANDIVYDLGAGTGVITSALARRCRHVMAIEIEPVTMIKLRQNVGELDNVTIVEKDILKLQLPNEPYKIFANIPFALSSEVVRKFTNTSNPPKSMYLIVQKQFARKLTPGNDHFTSELSAEIAPWFAVRIRKNLRKYDFTPPPGVDTVLLEIKPHDKPLLPATVQTPYRTFIERCFHDQKFFRTLDKPFSPELRPSQLTPEQWVELYAKVKP